MEGFITFLRSLCLLNLFIRSDATSFPGKRPIIPESGGCDAPSGENPIEIPKCYRPVLLKFKDNRFVSANGLLEISLLTEGLGTIHNFEKCYFEGEKYYFFFTMQELTEAGFDIIRRPNFNYWNAKAIRWELRGHGLENDWQDNIHRFYILSPNFYPVCYRLQEDGTFTTQHADFPVFTEHDFRNAECFRSLFEDESQVLRDAFFFIEFTSQELQSFGVCIPEDETGSKFNPFLAQFETVERPGPKYGWDSIFGEWVPFCQSCEPGCNKLDFWRFSLVTSVQNVCSVNVQSINFGSTISYPSNPFKRLFSSQGGPYCDHNCYCQHCFRYHDPSEEPEHQPNPDSKGGWTCDSCPHDELW
jgi:hypothetical protein